MATAAAEKEAPATKFAKDQLKAIIERIERLEEEKKTISDDIRDVYAEAKGNGFDVKALRTIVRLRKQDANERSGAGDHSRDISCRRSGCFESGFSRPSLPWSRWFDRAFGSGESNSSDGNLQIARLVFTAAAPSRGCSRGRCFGHGTRPLTPTALF